jgi:cobalt-zinc-cadmium efflux system outer membrane protein
VFLSRSQGASRALRRALPLLAAAIAWLVLAPARGVCEVIAPSPVASIKPARALGRDEAIRLGASSGPGVSVAAAPSAGIADASAGASAVLPTPPHVTISAGERSGATGRGLEVSATAIVEVPLRGIVGAREATARSLDATRAADLRRARLEAGARAGTAWTRAAEAKRILELRGESLGQADALADFARKRARVGTSQPIELALAEGDVGSARTSRLESEGLVVDALAELRLATALDAAAPVEPVGDLCATQDDLVDETTAWAAAERDNPDLQLAVANVRLSSDEIRLVSASVGPFLGVGATFTRDGFGDRVVSGVVTIPLPFTDPARFDAGRARIAADVAGAQVQRTRDELKTAVRVAIHDREHTRELRATLAEHALPPLREALRIAKAQIAAGTTDVTLALLVRQRVLAAEEQYVRACGEVQRADLRFERLIGRLPGALP